MMLQLRLFPPSMLPSGPDVIINAYAVNDFSYRYGEEARSGLSFSNLFGSFLSALNELTSCDRLRPLAIFLDDFSVNYLKANLVKLAEDYRNEITRLTNYHQILTVSYVDVIQDFLYSASQEQKLLVDWRDDKKHIPWGGHIAVVMIFAYNALNILVHFCESNAVSMHSTTAAPNLSKTAETPTQITSATRDLDAAFRPPLDSNLTLDRMDREWAQRHAQCSTDAPPKQTCPFAWIALRKEREHERVANVNSVLVEATGWVYDHTWPPTHFGLYGSRGGTAVLRVENGTDVSSITIIYMKSYSKKWYNSAVQAVVNRCGEQVASVQLSGYHKKNTSEHFTETIQFASSSNSSVCQSVELKLQVVGGKTFQIGGLSFC